MRDEFRFFDPGVLVDDDLSLLPVKTNPADPSRDWVPSCCVIAISTKLGSEYSVIATQGSAEAMYTIVFTASAVEDMAHFPKADCALIFDTAMEQLSHEPMTPTRNRKPLRPNELSQWEIRAGDYRIFYDVEEREQKVTVKAVGVKQHNALFIRGKEYRL